MSIFEVISDKALSRFHGVYMTLVKRAKSSIEKQNAAFLVTFTRFNFRLGKFPNAILFLFVVTLYSFCSLIFFAMTACLCQIGTHYI